MRSGTVPHTLVVGLGEACEIARKEMTVCTFVCMVYMIMCINWYVGLV